MENMMNQNANAAAKNVPAAMPATAKKARVSVVPENESKTARFARLAQSRVTKALKAIRAIGNLSDARYESTPENVTKITNALADAVEGTMIRFQPKASDDAAKFTL